MCQIKCLIFKIIECVDTKSCQENFIHRKKPLGRQKHRRNSNVKMHLKKEFVRTLDWLRGRGPDTGFCTYDFWVV